MSVRAPRESGTAKTGEVDSVARAGTLTFAPGETTKTITIEIKGDSKREANETFYLPCPLPDGHPPPRPRKKATVPGDCAIWPSAASHSCLA